MTDTKLVAFKLEQDDDNWPPFGSESMHVEVIDKNSFKISTPPFFLKGLAVGDIINPVLNTEGEICAFSHESKSENSTIWIGNPSNKDVSCKIKALLKLGCNCEELEQISLFAIDVPKDVNFDLVETLLEQIEDIGGLIAEPAFRH